MSGFGASTLTTLSMAAVASTCGTMPALKLRSNDMMPVRSRAATAVRVKSRINPCSNPPQVVGLGLWKIPQTATAQAVYDAIAAGYRHFDCACDYGNEAEVSGRTNPRSLSQRWRAALAGAAPTTAPGSLRCPPWAVA